MKSLGDFSLFNDNQKIEQIQIPQQVLKKIQTKLTLDNVVPPTIRSLNQILISRGFHGMGGITGGTSDNYIGRYYDKYVGAVLPYPQQVKVQKSLSFKQNFNYRMGQTVNAWNTYVTKQAQLKSFLVDMKTPQSRKIWIDKQIQSMSLVAQKYKWVVTLFYAYVFPQLKYHQAEDDKLNIQIKKSSKFNFLGLNMQQQQQILQIFLKNNGKSLQQLQSQLDSALFKAQNLAQSLGFSQIQRSIDQFRDILPNFQQSVTIYLTKQKLNQSAIKKVLNGKVDAENINYGQQNQIKQQVINYLNQNNVEKVRNESIMFHFPLSTQNYKQLPKLQLLQSKDTTYYQLLQLFKNDPDISKIIA